MRMDSLLCMIGYAIASSAIIDFMGTATGPVLFMQLAGAGVLGAGCGFIDAREDANRRSE